MDLQVGKGELSGAASKKLYLVKDLNDSFTKTVLYHDLFSYPLRLEDMYRWAGGEKLKIDFKNKLVGFRQGYFFAGTDSSDVLKRIMRERVAKRKLGLARRAAKIIGLIGMVRFVGVTGSLAMENASEDSDIDLMIITRKGRLWTSRVLVYAVLKIMGIKVRRPGDKNERDRLCLNVWLDEGEMQWEERNPFTAHEIAQVKPLLNRKKTYERFLYANSWIEQYWPNAARILDVGGLVLNEGSMVGDLMERLVYKMQYEYMKSKITREMVSENRALFHPVSWSEEIGKLLQS